QPLPGASPAPATWASALVVSSVPRLVDVHHVPQQLERLVLRALERVATDDRTEAAAVADRLDLLENRLAVLGLTAGEDHNPMPVEGGLHDVPNSIGEGLDRDVVLFVDLLRLSLLDVFLGRLHLDHVGPHLRRELSGVGNHVYGLLALLGDSAPAGITPDHAGKAMGFRLENDFAELLVHRVS